MKCPVRLVGMNVPVRTNSRSMMVKAIDADGLKTLLEDPTSSETVFLIDCRPFLSYNTGHIRAAHNVYCPPILRRRYGRNVPLESILGSLDGRKNLVDGHYGHIVVYDDSTFAEDGLIMEDLTSLSRTSASSHNLRIVLHSLIDVLSEEAGDRNLRYLNGGFDHFSKACEHLVKSEVISRTAAVNTSNEFSNAESNAAVAAAGKSNHMYCGPNCMKQGVSRKIGASEHHLGKSCDTVKCHSSHDKGDPVEILPWLYLGNAYHSSQEASLERLGIFALLNVAEMSDCDDVVPPVSSANFCHMNLPIADSSTSDISCKFPQAIEFIENVHLSGGKVLVHCLAGISRSPTICIAYLMHSRNISLDEAYDFVKQKRSLISPNLNFMRQLSEYERLLAPRQQSSAVNAACKPCDCVSANATISLTKSVLPLGSCTNLHQFAISKVKSNQNEDRKINGDSTVSNNISRKRPRPESLSFSIPCSGKPLKSVPYTPCTKQAIFTFDFPAVPVMNSSPTMSHSPLCSST